MDVDPTVLARFRRMEARELEETFERNKVRIQRLLTQVAAIRMQQADIHFELKRRVLEYDP